MPTRTDDGSRPVAQPADPQVTRVDPARNAAETDQQLVAIDDTTLWAQVCLAVRLRGSGYNISPLLVRATAFRYALAADENGQGSWVDLPLVAAELEVSVEDVMLALTVLNDLGLLAWGEDCFIGPEDFVPAGHYQLTLSDAISSHPAWRNVKGVFADADLAHREFRHAMGYQEEGRPLPPVALYRWYDRDERLLYIGITEGMATRQWKHARKSSWSDFAVRWTIERFQDRDEAQDAERKAIVSEEPLFNHVHNDTPEARQRLVAYLIERGRTDLLTPAISRG